MKAVHVNWTKPFYERHRLRGHGFKIQRELDYMYNQPDYQLLYTVLSILRWQKHNGPIKLYTDKVGLQFYKSIGITDLYDEIDTNALDSYTDIDPAHFWTSGKIHCLQFETEPFTFLDQDFIVRDSLPESTSNSDITIGHWEIPRGYYYFTREQFEAEVSHYQLPDNYNVNAWIPNTSFLRVNNLDIIKDYIEIHHAMVSTENTVPEWFWLLTDQGALGQCFRDKKYRIDTLTDKVFLSDSDYGSPKTRDQGLSEAWYYPIQHDKCKDEFEWEHVWLAKVVYGQDPEFMKRDCQRFAEEIWHVFPESRWILEQPRLCVYKPKEL